MEPAWLRKLNRAPEAVIQFVRNFSKVAGFEYAVKGFFGNRLQKRAAIMGMQLTRLISHRNPDQIIRMVFTQDVGYSAAGGMYLTLQMEVDGRYFIFLPWSVLEERTVRKHFSFHQQLFGSSDAFRWVLSSRAFGMQKEEILNQLRAMLETTLPERLAIVLP
jgi:hypothetical protein